MATKLFDVAAESLEQRSSFDRLTARGTLRIVLKAGGLDARTLTAEQMTVVVEKLLPTELTTRGVEDVAGVCAAILRSVESLPTAEDTTKSAGSIEDTFRRLGSD